MTLKERIEGIYRFWSPDSLHPAFADQILDLFSDWRELDPNQKFPDNPYMGEWIALQRTLSTKESGIYETAQRAMWEDGWRRVKPKEVQDG